MKLSEERRFDLIRLESYVDLHWIYMNQFAQLHFLQIPFNTKINNISVDCFGENKIRVIRNALFISVCFTHFKQRTQEI
jgi:hypothetical protein